MKKINLFFDPVDGVKNKKIITLNHFVSHMIEHIVWRLGVPAWRESYIDMIRTMQ